jgi:catalase
MTLNENPTNYFQQVEQAAFSPGTLVPGIEPSEDKLLQGRLFSYFDTQRHRLSGNFQQIPVNASKAPVTNYNQDGYMSIRPQTGDVNYQPSTSKPSVVDNAKFEYSKTEFLKNTTTVQQVIDKQFNFKQAGELYKSFSKNDQDNLIRNLSGALNAVKNRVIVAKMIFNFYQANSEYGQRLAKEVKMSREELESLISIK